MMALDLVITPDTMRRPPGRSGHPHLDRSPVFTRLALAARPLDDSPWYPTARLFRQCEPGRWNLSSTAWRPALEKTGRVATGLLKVLTQYLRHIAKMLLPCFVPNDSRHKPGQSAGGRDGASQGVQPSRTSESAGECDCSCDKPVEIGRDNPRALLRGEIMR